MKVVSTEEIINNKILPYNIYSEFGEKLFAAGEVLTPGKLLQLKHMSVLYRDDEISQLQTTESKTTVEHIDSAPLEAPKSSKNTGEHIVEDIIQEKTIEKAIAKIDEPITFQEEKKTTTKNLKHKEKPELIVEKFDMKPSGILRNKLSVDDIDIGNYKGPINRSSKIDPQTQLKIKAFYNKILDMMEDRPSLEMLGMFANIRDKIVQDILSESNDVLLSSQLKLLGEYNKCHALNTAILSGAVAKKMNLSENTIYDVVLAGLLHDIGKNSIPPELLSKSNLLSSEQRIIQNHTKSGYKTIKLDMNLSENIARVALEHHENNDGSGYPNGLSGDRIGIESKIISVCNYFDNLTSNRTHHQVRNTKEALKIMLRMGTQKFSADALYTFIHMFSYNDTMNFEEMVL